MFTSTRVLFSSNPLRFAVAIPCPKVEERSAPPTTCGIELINDSTLTLLDISNCVELIVEIGAFETKSPLGSNEPVTITSSITGTFFAYFSIVIVNFGDFSRYSKSESEVNKGNLSLLLNLLIFSFLAISLVIGSSVFFEKNLIPIDRLLTNPTDIVGKIDNTLLTFIALLFILVASGSTNLIANYVPSQNSIINFFPNKFSQKSSGILIIFLGLIFAVFWDPVLSKIGILSFIDTLGSFFGPIAGVMIIDYYFIKNKIVINKDIFSSHENGAYYYSGGWQIKAIYSLFIGFIFASATIWNADLRFLQSFSWLIGAFFSSITYYLLAKK